MGQAKANDKVESDIAIKDAIGKEIVETNKKQLKSEIDTFEKNIISAQKALKNYQDQWELDKELWEIQLKDMDCAQIEPVFHYHKNPRFWELIKKKKEYQYRFDEHNANAKLTEYTAQMKQLEDELKSSRDKLNDLEGDEKNE